MCSASMFLASMHAFLRGLQSAGYCTWSWRRSLILQQGTQNHVAPPQHNTAQGTQDHVPPPQHNTAQGTQDHVSPSQHNTAQGTQNHVAPPQHNTAYGTHVSRFTTAAQHSTGHAAPCFATTAQHSTAERVCGCWLLAWCAQVTCRLHSTAQRPPTRLLPLACCVQVDVPAEIARDLLVASDQYLLEGLKRLCEMSIAQVRAPGPASCCAMCFCNACMLHRRPRTCAVLCCVQMPACA